MNNEFYYDHRVKKSFDYRNLQYELTQYHSIDAVKITREELMKVINARDFSIAIEKYRIK